MSDTTDDASAAEFDAFAQKTLEETIESMNATLMKEGEPPLSARETLLFSCSMGGVVVLSRMVASVEAMTCEYKDKIREDFRETFLKMTPEERRVLFEKGKPK